MMVFQAYGKAGRSKDSSDILPFYPSAVPPFSRSALPPFRPSAVLPFLPFRQTFISPEMKESLYFATQCKTIPTQDQVFGIFKN